MLHGLIVAFKRNFYSLYEKMLQAILYELLGHRAGIIFRLQRLNE